MVNGATGSRPDSSWKSPVRRAPAISRRSSTRSASGSIGRRAPARARPRASERAVHRPVRQPVRGGGRHRPGRRPPGSERAISRSSRDRTRSGRCCRFRRRAAARAHWSTRRSESAARAAPSSTNGDSCSAFGCMVPGLEARHRPGTGAGRSAGAAGPADRHADAVQPRAIGRATASESRASRRCGSPTAPSSSRTPPADSPSRRCQRARRQRRAIGSTWWDSPRRATICRCCRMPSFRPRRPGPPPLPVVHHRGRGAGRQLPRAAGADGSATLLDQSANSVEQVLTLQAGRHTFNALLESTSGAHAG